MKRLGLISIFILFAGSAFANCPAGHTLSTRITVLAPGVTVCPSGFVDSDRYVLPDAGGGCPAGYVLNNNILPVFPCDPARGICDDNLFICLLN